MRNEAGKGRKKESVPNGIQPTGKMGNRAQVQSLRRMRFPAHQLLSDSRSLMSLYEPPKTVANWLTGRINFFFQTANDFGAVNQSTKVYFF